MGDRTYVNLNVHPEDLEHPAWKQWLDDWGEGAYGNSDNHFFYEEVNYAAYTPLQELAEAGVRFVGDHGSGGEYGACDFFHDGGGVVHYNPDLLWSENRIVVNVSSGWPHEGDIREQLKLLHRWNEFWRVLREHQESADRQRTA